MDARVSTATMPKAALDQAPAPGEALDLVRVLGLEEAQAPDLPGLGNGNNAKTHAGHQAKDQITYDILQSRL